MCACFACMYVCVPHAFQVPVEAKKEGIGSPETGVTDGCEPLCRCWELNPDPLSELPLTAESSL